MNRELKDKWVTALTNGDYVQTTDHTLREFNGYGRYCYCALGVLADIIDPEGWDDNLSGVWRNDVTIPPSVSLEIDLHYSNISTIMKMNDDHKKPFSEIALYIQESVM